MKIPLDESLLDENRLDMKGGHLIFRIRMKFIYIQNENSIDLYDCISMISSTISIFFIQKDVFEFFSVQFNVFVANVSILLFLHAVINLFFVSDQELIRRYCFPGSYASSLPLSLNLLKSFVHITYSHFSLTFYPHFPLLP